MCQSSEAILFERGVLEHAHTIEGRVETSVVRPMGRGVTVDRKTALMVHELKKYDMNITGISEMKWFGHDTYEVEGHVILHSGCPLPDESPMECGEGQGLVLCLTLQ